MVEHGGGDDRTLGHPRLHCSEGGLPPVVMAAGGPASKVGGQPPDKVAVEVGITYLPKQPLYGDSVKGLAEIDEHTHCALGWLGLVYAGGGLRDDGEKC